jgi:exodeoxyribonuclease V alpha subunit
MKISNKEIEQDELEAGVMNTQTLIKLRATLKEEVYQDPSSAFCIWRVSLDGHSNSTQSKSKFSRNELIVKGEIEAPIKDLPIEFYGQWEEHPKYGLQFAFTSYSIMPPKEVQALKKYLLSDHFPNIGAKTVEKLIEYFGVDTCQKLDEYASGSISGRLQIPGISEKRSEQLLNDWNRNRGVQSLILFLAEHGLSVHMANRLIEEIGTEAYLLHVYLKGISFQMADQIAFSMGIESKDPLRIQAGILTMLKSLSNNGGHVVVPYETLLEDTATLLHISFQEISNQLLTLNSLGKIILKEYQRRENDLPQEGVYLPRYYQAEQIVYSQINRILNSSPWSLASKEPVLDPQSKVLLTEEQYNAVKTAYKRPFSILTGGPGTGTTSSIKTLVYNAQKDNKTILLVAPTGRAAQRLSESANMSASTIHRALGYQNGAFEYNQANPLQVDLIIVDECSMLDIELAASFFQAVRSGTHVLFVGDPDQLPSVGPGDVLRDLIASSVIPTVQLTQIFRQSEDSTIISNAHAINHGEMPSLNDSNDSYYFPVAQDTTGEELIIEIVVKRIPARFGVDPLRIQVLSPMYKGYLGVENVNRLLQEALNPASVEKEEIEIRNIVFRENDKVMVIRNNYEKNVFNGDIGFIIAIDHENKEVDIQVENGEVVIYEFDELDALRLAYAITIHKSQGSEYKYAVIVISREHIHMLSKNLLYTAITRAKDCMIMIGHKSAIRAGVENDQASIRQTELTMLIKHDSDNICA